MIGLFYASDWGHTEKVARLIEEELGEDKVKIHDLQTDPIEEAEKYDQLIFGVSTADKHLPQLDWQMAMKKLDQLDLEGKTVALFGLGDQKEFPDNFADALGDLFDKVNERGANIIGSWLDNEYTFQKSKAFRDGAFVGLVLDEDNQQDLTEIRLQKWLSRIDSEI